MLAFLKTREVHSAVRTEAAIEARVNGIGVGSAQLRPLRNAVGGVVNSYRANCGSVSHLRELSCPLDISYLVMAVVVYAIQRMCVARSQSDVFQKLRKGFKAKFNTTPAVTQILRGIWIEASVFCSGIRHIFRRLVLSFRMSVNQVDVSHTVLYHEKALCY